jgi:hypothetical protein
MKDLSREMRDKVGEMELYHVARQMHDLCSDLKATQVERKAAEAEVTDLEHRLKCCNLIKEKFRLSQSLAIHETINRININAREFLEEFFPNGK